MEVAMETGTLKELDVKPGDVVECVEIGASIFTYGDQYVITHLGGVVDDEGDDWMERFNCNPITVTFRIISRANTTPDLTAITTPFGLLDAATQEALRAHGGPYVRYDDHGEWVSSDYPFWYPGDVYRVKPGPIIETETMKITNADGMPMAYATVTTRNGKPDWSTLQVRHD